MYVLNNKELEYTFQKQPNREINRVVSSEVDLNQKFIKKSSLREVTTAFSHNLDVADPQKDSQQMQDDGHAGYRFNIVNPKKQKLHIDNNFAQNYGMGKEEKYQSRAVDNTLIKEDSNPNIQSSGTPNSPDGGDYKHQSTLFYGEGKEKENTTRINSRQIKGDLELIKEDIHNLA